MKKKLIILLFFIAIIFGCAKNELTSSNFIDIAKYNGYVISNTKKGYENYNYIKDIYYAINRENLYDIQFLELENDEYAKRFFDNNKSDLLNYVDDYTYVKNKNNNNYSVFHIENDELYMLIIRNNNNILYINAPIDYINEIEEFLEELDIDY